MSSDIINLGIGPLTDNQLEELVSTVEEKINGHIQKHSHWQLLTDFNFIVNLSQSSDNLITLTLDFDMSGGLTTQELEKFQKELNEFGQEIIKEELICLKNS